MEDSPRIKVTDRRMFTADGELREDSELEAEEAEPSEAEREPRAAAPAAAPPAAHPAAPGASEAPRADREASQAPGAGAQRGPDPDPALAGEPASGVGFLDLVGMLAEPIALYLGDLALPDGERTVDLDQARVYIDLLGILQEKTRGNLAREEEAVLSDLVYRLKMRYVQKRQGG